MAEAGAPWGERRSAAERREARRWGVDRYGRPTPRVLGLAPRQLRSQYPSLSPPDAARLSAALVSDVRLVGARGAAPLREPSPATETVSPAGRPQADPGAAGVDSGSGVGQG